jgi:hypothetical protein
MNYWSFCGILLYWKCISENLKKKKKTLSYRIGPCPWARPNPHRPSRLARGAHPASGQRPSRPRRRLLEPDTVARASLDAAARPSSPALTSDFRPLPFVSVAGEHTFAILDLLSPFCISPKPLAARNSVDLMRQGKFLYVRSSCPCSCLEVEDKVALRIGPYPFL